MALLKHACTCLLAPLILFLAVPVTGSAQPNQTFKSPTLVSGTARTANAVYRFSGVEPGVEALVTIISINNATIGTFDYLVSGFDDAFQPTVHVNGNTSGYAEFEIVFVDSGTSTATTIDTVYITSVDVDGLPGPIYEFDEYRMDSALVDYDSLGVDISVTEGTWIVGTNTSAIDYLGIDTVQKNVMFTVIGFDVDTFRVRAGADNQSGSSIERLRSFYFREFNYPNSLLPVSLVNFEASWQNEAVELIWTTALEVNNDRFEIERAFMPGQTETIEVVPAALDGNRENNYSIVDYEPLNGTSFYRLKQVDTDGHFTYSSWIKVVSAKTVGFISVLPNPAIDDHVKVNLEGSYSDKFDDIRVIDVRGMIREAPIKIRDLLNGKQVVISTLNLESGMYFLQCASGSELISATFLVQ